MALMDAIKAKAKADLKHIVWPRNRAAYSRGGGAHHEKRGLAKVTLLGECG